MLRFDVLLTESQIADDFLAALAARQLAEKFFYWFPLSVKAWLSLCGEGEYRNYSRSYALVKAHAEELPAALPSKEADVLSLGAGQGDKDLVILSALRAAGSEPDYVPVDSSQSLLEVAARAALDGGFVARAVKADLSDRDHRAALTAPNGPPRLVLLLGNTLGGFDPLELAPGVRRILRPEDRLLVDGEVFRGEETLAGYDNPINRRFAFAPLKSIGVKESDGELRFELDHDDRMPGLHLIPKHFEPARDLELTVAGETVRLARGERIHMNHSYKYTREAFLHLLEGARLLPEWEHATEDGQFLLVLARPS